MRRPLAPIDPELLGRVCGGEELPLWPCAVGAVVGAVVAPKVAPISMGVGCAAGQILYASWRAGQIQAERAIPRPWRTDPRWTRDVPDR
jgi:hypothetical protein